MIYVRVAFREGAPEISRRNQRFSALAGAGGMGLDDAATQVHPAVAPQPGDVVVVKKRVSAFAGSDLEMVLRGLEVDSLVLSGIATSGVVLSTLRQATDLDFALTVLCGGCADPAARRVRPDGRAGGRGRRRAGPAPRTGHRWRAPRRRPRTRCPRAPRPGGRAGSPC